MLEEAIRKVRELPEADQDEAAEILLSVAARRGEPVRLDDETRAAIREGREQARRGEFVSEEDMAAFFKRHGIERDSVLRLVPNRLKNSLSDVLPVSPSFLMAPETGAQHPRADEV